LGIHDLENGPHDGLWSFLGLGDTFRDTFLVAKGSRSGTNLGRPKLSPLTAAGAV
jgi:hypothetical protein